MEKSGPPGAPHMKPPGSLPTKAGRNSIDLSGMYRSNSALRNNQHLGPCQPWLPHPAPKRGNYCKGSFKTGGRGSTAMPSSSNCTVSCSVACPRMARSSASPAWILRASSAKREPTSSDSATMRRACRSQVASCCGGGAGDSGGGSDWLRADGPGGVAPRFKRGALRRLCT